MATKKQYENAKAAVEAGNATTEQQNLVREAATNSGSFGSTARAARDKGTKPKSTNFFGRG